MNFPLSFLLPRPQGLILIKIESQAALKRGRHTCHSILPLLKLFFRYNQALLGLTLPKRVLSQKNFLDYTTEAPLFSTEGNKLLSCQPPAVLEQNHGN